MSNYCRWYASGRSNQEEWDVISGLSFSFNTGQKASKRATRKEKPTEWIASVEIADIEPQNTAVEKRSPSKAGPGIRKETPFSYEPEIVVEPEPTEFYIRVASCRLEESANVVEAKLVEAGHRVLVSFEEPWHRVFAGPYPSREDAGKAKPGLDKLFSYTKIERR